MILCIVAVSPDTLVLTVTATDPDDGATVQYSIPYDSIEAIDKNGNPVTSQVFYDYKVSDITSLLSETMFCDRLQGTLVAMMIWHHVQSMCTWLIDAVPGCFLRMHSALTQVEVISESTRILTGMLQLRSAS